MVEYIPTLPEDGTDGNKTHDDNASKKRQRRKAVDPTSTVERSNICIQLPRWLCQYAWDLTAERAWAKRIVTLQFFKALNHGDEVWFACRDGGIGCIKMRLDHGRLSIYDQNILGETLFAGRKSCLAPEKSSDSVQAAAMYCQTELAQFLLDSGANCSWIPRPVSALPFFRLLFIDNFWHHLTATGVLRTIMSVPDWPYRYPKSEPEKRASPDKNADPQSPCTFHDPRV